MKAKPKTKPAPSNAKSKTTADKFKLPENFHERVLELEKQIEREKEGVSHIILRDLALLYSVSLSPLSSKYWQINFIRLFLKYD